MNTQLRRLRYNSILRGMLEETSLIKENFIQPLFIKAGQNFSQEIESMPGIYQLSLDKTILAIEKMLEKGLNKFLLFGIPHKKDEIGSDVLSTKGIMAESIYQLKKKFPDIYLISDVCFCGYMTHGHCGFIHNQEVDNEKTIQGLADQALIHAQAGIDMVAPSAMMDNMIKSIRLKLDENGYPRIPIMSYAVKFASAFYGPFREAAESSPQFGDRNTYQLNMTNPNEAMREALLDLEEGADIIMVKPGIAYLDILARLREKILAPLAVYQVSGEYTMLKLAASKKTIDEKRTVLETMMAFRRAGAQLIISYYSQELVSWL